MLTFLSCMNMAGVTFCVDSAVATAAEVQQRYLLNVQLLANMQFNKKSSPEMITEFLLGNFPDSDHLFWLSCQSFLFTDKETSKHLIIKKCWPFDLSCSQVMKTHLWVVLWLPYMTVTSSEQVVLIGAVMSCWCDLFRQRKRVSQSVQSES